MRTFTKPLGHKAYGSIPHLPGSRRGPGDYGLEPDQCVRLLSKVKDRKDRVIVEEKLDGSNVAAAKINGQIVAVTRAGVLASESDYPQHRMWARWVASEAERFDALLTEGERVCGEWLAQAVSTRYDLSGRLPFVAFDLRRKHDRAPTDEVRRRCWAVGLETPRCLSDGPPMSVEHMLLRLEPSGHGAMDPVEGAIWRLERDGVFLLVAKYVRHDKVDGSLFPEHNGGVYTWNWHDGVDDGGPMGPVRA